MRTTIDLEVPILKELKAFSRSQGSSLGKITTQLLAEALAMHKSAKKSPPKFQWISHSMGAKVDLADKEALYSILDQRL